MYCQTCGSALTLHTNYCNRCGTQLTTTTNDKNAYKTPAEKRLDEYLEGLFWISALGLGIIIGGSIALKSVQFSDWIIIVYAVLSSTVFLINFGISLWGALSLMRSSKDGKMTIQPGHADTRELPPARGEPLMVPSVTENTTRAFEKK